MSKGLKKALSVALCLIMLFGTVAVGGEGFADLLDALTVKASAENYEAGDIIEYGSYPQTDVTSSLGSALDLLGGTWQSYNYYIDTGAIDGQMTASDYMRYKDVTYNGNKYRAVTFDRFRSYCTGVPPISGPYINTYQDGNGYTTDNVYWFKYEPLKWRVLDKNTGLIMCATIIDSQPYNSYVIENGTDGHGCDAYWGDSAQTYYANNYAESSIREWLNNDFYDTAFTSAQKSNIKTTTLNNDCYSTLAGDSGYEEYDAPSTIDKVFLLSYDQALNSEYGFDSAEWNEDTAKRLQGSDYAKCQGLYVHNSSNIEYNGNGNSPWLLRSPSNYSRGACNVSGAGTAYGNAYVNYTCEGVVPALQLSDLKSDISQFEMYKVSYNANSGTDAPEWQTKYYDKDLTLREEVPTRTGYTFMGWNTKADGSGTSYAPGATYRNNADVTLYAQWTKTTAFIKSNRFSFSNSGNHFITSWSKGTYYLTQADSEKLFGYIRKNDINSGNTISNIQAFMKKSWSGSCYGMSVASILDYRNDIAFNENFGTNAATLYDVKSPSTDPKIMSAINYYMVSQKIGFIRNESNYYDESNWDAGLRELVSVAQQGKPFLFCYYWVTYNQNGEPEYHGHAIVGLDSKLNSDGTYSIRAYDNRYPDKDVIISVNFSTSKCIVNGKEDAYGIEIDSDMSAFNKIDIDGPNNDMNIITESNIYENSNTELEVTANGNITISNSEGETISIIDGIVSNTMNILSTHLIVNDNENGDAAPVSFIFEVPNSNTFTIESTNSSINAAITSDSLYASASANNADSIVFGDNEGVYVIGENMEYQTALSSKDADYDTVIVEGASDKDVSLTYSESDVLINGVNGNNETIMIFAHDAAEPEEYNVEDGYNKVKVVSAGGDIDIKGSSNNDGVFDVSVIKKDTPEQENPTSSAKLNIPANTEVEYAATVTVTATASGVPEGYFVALYEGGKLLARGDNTKASYKFPGEFKSAKTITAKIIDEKENVQKDAGGKDLSASFEVKAKSGFFAKLIAFFKRLFKTLPSVEVKPR